MKPAVLSMLLLALTVMNTRAQGFHVGIKAGANIFKVDGQSMSDGFRFGYNAGAFAEVNFTSKWGLQPELLWNQTNYHTGDHFSAIYPNGLSDVKGKLNYLSIPLLLSYKPVKILSLQLGPQFGILINQDKNLVQNGKEAFKKGDFSVVGGAQLNILSFKIGARYLIGLNDINDLGNDEKWKNTGFQVYAGFRFF